jgi:hypothetical protein
VQGWQRIIAALTTDAASAARTVFDILNEPDALNLRWEAYTDASGRALPSVSDAYHRIMADGFAINPGKFSTTCRGGAACVATQQTYVHVSNRTREYTCHISGRCSPTSLPRAPSPCTNRVFSQQLV